jgi:peroxiredoxin (alkyl hydroperoxide reductase subunit C)
MTLKVGDLAPDFTLKGNDDKDHTLSAYRGKPVVLVFYPLDFSPVCEKEHACFVEDLAKFSALDAQVFGISVDSVWAHKAFAKQLQISYPLLADFHPKGAVAEQYGAYLADKGITARTNFVIDKDGKVALIQTNDIPKVPELEPLLAALGASK